MHNYMLNLVCPPRKLLNLGWSCAPQHTQTPNRISSKNSWKLKIKAKSQKQPERNDLLPGTFPRNTNSKPRKAEGWGTAIVKRSRKCQPWSASGWIILQEWNKNILKGKLKGSVASRPTFTSKLAKESSSNKGNDKRRNLEHQEEKQNNRKEIWVHKIDYPSPPEFYKLYFMIETKTTKPSDSRQRHLKVGKVQAPKWKWGPHISFNGKMLIPKTVMSLMYIVIFRETTAETREIYSKTPQINHDGILKEVWVTHRKGKNKKEKQEWELEK